MEKDKNIIKYITPKGVIIFSHLYIILNTLCAWLTKHTTLSHSKSKTVSNNNNMTYIF